MSDQEHQTEETSEEREETLKDLDVTEADAEDVKGGKKGEDIFSK